MGELESAWGGVFLLVLSVSTSLLFGCLVLWGMERLRIVGVGSWRCLPEVLGPGVYIVSGERIEVLEKVSRDALRNTLEAMKKRRGIYV